MMDRIVVATRGSKLAVAQTQIVVDAIKAHHPAIDIEIVTISTAGDRDRISPLWKMSGSGFFTTQVEQALIEKQADVAIHSFKDLPTQMTEGLTVAAIFERQFPEDVLVATSDVNTLADLPAGAVIGTSSPRRIAMLKHLRSDLETKLIRGNVETRLDKVRQGEYDAIVLARAGLERLGLGGQTTFAFDPTEFIPAPAQGALAIQCRSDDEDVRSILACVHHEATAMNVAAERRVLSALHPGCHAPAGVYAMCRDGDMTIRGFVSSLDGVQFINEQVTGPMEKKESLADRLTVQLFTRGAEDILKELETE
ncbi:MAG: hydroxymethylbilane synthase [Planctomycetota bacterium]|jgi:hydroxymethylbilane synthase